MLVEEVHVLDAITLYQQDAPTLYTNSIGMLHAAVLFAHTAADVPWGALACTHGSASLLDAAIVSMKQCQASLLKSPISPEACINT